MKNLLKQSRQDRGLKLREVAAHLGIDQALISKFESGDRLPTEKQLQPLAELLNIPFSEIKVQWLSQKIYRDIKNDPYAKEAVQRVNEALAGYNVQLGRQYSEEIEELLEEIDAAKKVLDDYRQNENFRITEALQVEYTYESNRIEGNTLTLQETDFVINQGFTISGKSMQEHLEAINHYEAIGYIKDLVDKESRLNTMEVLNIHQLILRGINPDYAGKYRNVQVFISGSQHEPPAPYLVQKKMEDLFYWYQQHEQVLHPVVLAAEMHEKLVTIHPFIDGNGRTSRLLMNLLLLQKGYVIANISGEQTNRLAYYTALEKARKGDEESFVKFIATVERDCIKRYVKALRGV